MVTQCQQWQSLWLQGGFMPHAAPCSYHVFSAPHASGCWCHMPRAAGVTAAAHAPATATAADANATVLSCDGSWLVLCLHSQTPLCAAQTLLNPSLFTTRSLPCSISASWPILSACDSCMRISSFMRCSNKGNNQTETAVRDRLCGERASKGRCLTAAAPQREQQ